MDLGVVPAGKELVFFLVTQYESRHDLDQDWVYPCLRKASTGQCTLHLKSPIQVFFSKARWNLDQDPRGRVPVAQRNIGCAYSDLCNPDLPQMDSCPVLNSTQRLCGWLSADTLTRLQQPAYGNVVLPRVSAGVLPSGNGNMPHLLMQPSPSTPGQWLMGFEDMPGGGDRDFNDVVFLLRGTQEGRVRSRVLSQDDASCRIAQVSFTKRDVLGTGCDATAGVTYAVATDCGLCGAGTCVPNPTPTWHPLSLPPGAAGTTVDVSGTPGQQLCWKAQVTQGASFGCLPAIVTVDVGYVSEPVAP
ncbi:DUF4114 domain-containing protein [Corallococcus coralloides]|uniref:DUF4114 domain-containing protein n=1 Tax=Corallococcus coralloides TaxID=184914 RepID=UPI00384DC6BB